MSRISKSVETESRIIVDRGVGAVEQKWKVISNGSRVSFGGNKTVLKLFVVLSVQHSEYSKNIELCNLNR